MADDSFPGWQAAKTVDLVTSEGMTQVFVKGRLYMSDSGEWCRVFQQGLRGDGTTSQRLGHYSVYRC